MSIRKIYVILSNFTKVNLSPFFIDMFKRAEILNSEVFQHGLSSEILKLQFDSESSTFIIGIGPQIWPVRSCSKDSDTKVDFYKLLKTSFDASWCALSDETVPKMI